MTLEIEKLLDETGWHLLEELQKNARLSYSELGQRVGLSSPAVAERVRRLEEAGIITGYHAEVNMAKLGLPITAITRMGNQSSQSCSASVISVSQIPEVIECSRVTGSDSLILKVIAASVGHLETLIDKLSAHGLSTTSIVLSTPIKRRVITHEIVESGKEQEERSNSLFSR